MSLRFKTVEDFFEAFVFSNRLGLKIKFFYLYELHFILFQLLRFKVLHKKFEQCCCSIVKGKCLNREITQENFGIFHSSYVFERWQTLKILLCINIIQ